VAGRGFSGKRVGGFLYFHKEALAHVPEDARVAVEEAAAKASFDWNVAKYSPSRLSLMLYEDFDAVAFPALLSASSYDPASGAFETSDYSGRENPPILHRKETLLPPDDPRLPAFLAVTRKAEEKGLFADTKRIGTRAVWQRMLSEAGLRTEGPRLVSADEAPVEVSREKTALARTGLSQPVGLMIRFGMLDKENEVFDYGCGRGDDVATLQANGYAAFGWDPNHRSDGERRQADIVNLGFVLNVIENPHEREETLRTAWGYARRGMAVAVMPQGKYRTDGLKAHGDGWLSSKRTFQKYFSQDEITELVRSVTGERPVTLAPGILAVFRDKDLEQQVAFRKRSRSLLFPDMALPPRPERARPAGAEPLAVRAGDELGSIWRTALALGRIPTEEEVDAETREALQGKGISVGRALAACVREVLDPDLLSQAAAARKEDLLVHFALSLFPGAPRYGSLPASIQRDVRTFFGTHAAVMEAARQELLSLRNPETLEEAFSLASSESLASFEAGALRFAMERLPRMPVAVRIVMGCAEIVHEGISAADLAEVTTRPVAVTVLACEGLDTALPRVRSRTEVDLARQRTKMRSYEDRVLYLRSRFLERGHPGYAKQLAADTRLLSLGIVDEAGRGPKAGDLAALMAGVGRGE
jgi:DNA phosphorothioation-associated putative methyltransferase